MKNAKLEARANDVANNAGLVEEVVNDLLQEIKDLETHVEKLETENGDLMEEINGLQNELDQK